MVKPFNLQQCFFIPWGINLYPEIWIFFYTPKYHIKKSKTHRGGGGGVEKTIFICPTVNGSHDYFWSSIEMQLRCISFDFSKRCIYLVRIFSELHPCFWLVCTHNSTLSSNRLQRIVMQNSRRRFILRFWFVCFNCVSYKWLSLAFDCNWFIFSILFGQV